MVPEVAFWWFWGLVCIEKWCQNFDSGTRSAIFDTPKMTKIPRFSHFEGTQKRHFEFPNQNSETTFQYKLAPKIPKNPPQESDLER